MKDEIADNNTKKVSAIPNFPEALNECGYRVVGYQGRARALPVREAATYKEHVAFTSEPTFPMKNGFRILPLGFQEAVRFFAERGIPRIQ